MKESCGVKLIMITPDSSYETTTDKHDRNSVYWNISLLVVQRNLN